MQSFNTSYLTENSAYTITKNAHAKLQTIDRRSDEARQIETQLNDWNNVQFKMQKFVEARGLRYAPCTFENFVVSSKTQQKVVDALIAYAANSKDLIAKGKNVLVLGSKGTGKDHLLCALAKRCQLESGSVPHWQNGVDLLEQFHREALNGYYRFHDPLEHSDILYVSDPIPPTGSLSESKQASMFRVIDSRYSQLKPTWMTLNVADGDEAEKRMGAQTVDRLRDGALVLFCNWASYRKVAT